MSKLNKIPKVAYISLYCPHYRNAVFSLVSQNEQFEFFVYSAENFLLLLVKILSFTLVSL